MGAIGDYVHWSWQGYEKYGTSKRGPGESVDFSYFSSVRNELLKKISKDVEQKDMEEIKNNILAVMKPREAASEEGRAVQDAIIDIQDTRYKESAGDKDFLSGSVTTAKKRQDEAERAILKKIAVRDADKLYNISNIQARIEAIRNSIGFTKNLKEKAEFRAAFIKAAKDFKTILTKIQGKNSATPGAGRVSGTATSRSGASLDSIIEEINKAFTAYVATPSIGVQSGEFFEYIIAGASYRGLGLVEEALNEEDKKILDSFVVGAKTSSVAFEKSRFSVDLKGILNEGKDTKGQTTTKNFYGLQGDLYLSVRETQDKVDVEYYMPDYTKYNISAKNYKKAFSNTLTLVEGTSLLYLLQGADTDYVNHYLNITATHRKGKGDSDSSELQRKAAHTGMKYIILFYALRGGLLGKGEAADIFVVNDSSKTDEQSLGVFSMKEVLIKAYEDIENNAIVKSKKDGDLTSIRFNNDGSKTNNENARIENLFRDIHSHKIHAAIRGRILKEVPNK